MWVFDNDSGLMYMGNCMELMGCIEAGTVDMILCDLPYGITDLVWDIPLCLDGLWEHYERIVSANGVIVLTASQPFATKLISSNPGLFKYEWIWVKNHSTGFTHAKNMPLRQHENILVFSKGKIAHSNSGQINRMSYYPVGLVPINKEIRSSSSKFGNANKKRPSHRNSVIRQNTNYPKSVLNFSVEKGLHPSQKPAGLFEYLIRTYTKEQQLVLDNCAGSGTTGVACVKSNRRFILIEKSLAYCQTAAKRIEKTIKEINMKKTILTLLLVVAMVSAPTKKTHAVWWWVVKAAVKKAIKAADLAIQRQQNKVIWLQNAQKTLENTMSKLKLKEIGDWTDRQKTLYKNYFDELNKVKLLITYYQRIRDITARQLQLVEEYKRAWRLVRNDKNLTPDDVLNIGRVYEGIINETIINIEQLGLAVNSFKTQMSDAKRIEIIDNVSNRVDQNYYDLKRYNYENAKLSISRSKDVQEIELIKKLYGID